MYLFQKDWVPCQYCPDAYPSKSQTKSHETNAHVKAYLKRPKHPFACQECKLVIDKSRQVQHRRHKHPELKDGWTHCKHCKLVFRCDAQLKDHLDEDSRCNSQYSEEDLMKIHTNVIQSKKVNTQPERTKESMIEASNSRLRTRLEQESHSSEPTKSSPLPNVTFTLAPIVERQPDRHPDSASSSTKESDECKVVAIKKYEKNSNIQALTSRLRKRLEQEDQSSVTAKSARPSSPEITVISDSRSQECSTQLPVITQVGSLQSPGEPLNPSPSILRQMLEVDPNKPTSSSNPLNPDLGVGRLGIILKQNLDKKLQKNQSQRKFVTIAPKPSNNQDHNIPTPATSTSTICQRCQSQFQLFENINSEVAALKPAANQLVLMESVHAVIANWSQCNNCPKAYPHDFKIDSRLQLKSGIHDVNLDDIDTNLPFLGILK